MKFNKKLLPIKAHYFLLCGGNAPIFPFLPVILRDLGFSSISVGWIFTAYPLLTIICKPFMGTVADKFSCHRFLTLALIFFNLVALFGIQWAPGLPSTTSAELLNCDGHLKLSICSEKLNSIDYKKKIASSLSSTVTCKVDVLNWNKLKGNENLMNDSIEDNPVAIKIGPSYAVKDNCLITEISYHQVKNLTDYPEQRSKNISVLTDIYCEDAPLMEIATKRTIEEAEEMGTYQFWVVFALIVSIRISCSVAQSFTDAFCFVLLGDKKENYGLQRMWGAVSWGLVSFINGIIVDRLSRGLPKKNFLPSYYMLLVLLLIDMVVVFRFKVKFSQKSGNIVGNIEHLFKDIRICIFMIWCFLCGIYCAIVWNFLFWFIEDLAQSNPNFDMAWIKTLEGAVIAVQCYFGEIPFFFFSGWILKKVGHPKAMMIVLFFYGVRFLLYSSLDNPWWILPIEVANGLTFGLFYATMVTYASSIAPAGTEATVQNLVGAVFEGAGVSVGSLIGGYLFKKIGSSETLFILGSSAIGFGFMYFFLQGKLVNEKEEIRSAQEAVERKNMINRGEELQKLNSS